MSGLLFWCLVSLTDAKTSVGSQTAQGHDVEASLVFGRVHAAAHCSYHNVIVVGCNTTRQTWKPTQHTYKHIKQAECAVYMAQAAPTQLCQLPDFQHILVELVVVGDREDNLVQPLQLLDVVLGDVPQLNPTPANRNKHEN